VPGRPVQGRLLTWFAVGFLVLDGLLLLLAALWSRRPGPGIGGLVCLAAAAGVVALWRRHRRRLNELQEARRALAAEARSLQALLRRPLE
jgi:hypothetical protein